jgi:hypothetical protein
MATLARRGETTTSTATPSSVPRKEKTIPAPRAFPASPFFAMGLPSKHVATEDGVPGMFRRMADMSPPEMPPI